MSHIVTVKTEVRDPAAVSRRPSAGVPALGSPEHGFPLLSGAGRLVVKDAIMMGAALVTMADSAKAYLRRNDRRRTAGYPAGRGVCRRLSDTRQTRDLGTTSQEQGAGP